MFPGFKDLTAEAQETCWQQSDNRTAFNLWIALIFLNHPWRNSWLCLPRWPGILSKGSHPSATADAGYTCNFELCLPCADKILMFSLYIKSSFMCLIKITTFLLTISLSPLWIFASVCCSSCVWDRYMPVIVLFSLCKLSRKTFLFTAYNNFYVFCGHVSVIK